MPSWNQLVEAVSVTTQTVITSAETTVATAVISNPSGLAVVLLGFCMVSGGTAATGIILRIRQDSITGTARNNPTAQTVVAGNNQPFLALGLSASGETAQRTYVLTVQESLATANWSVFEAALVAIAI